MKMPEEIKRKATVERSGSMVVIRMTGGPDCLWLNMYLDTDTWSMTCDSDIGFYAYHWGRGSSISETFLPFCLRWLADEAWLLRKCIGERHIDKGWDYEKTRQALLNAYKEEQTDEDDPDCDTYYIEEALSRAAQFDDVDAFAAALQAEADSLGVDLPEEWWGYIDRDYTPWQKRFAEICREVIVPALSNAKLKCRHCGEVLHEIEADCFLINGEDDWFTFPITSEEEGGALFRLPIEWCGADLGDGDREDCIRCPKCKKYPFSETIDMNVQPYLEVVAFESQTEEERWNGIFKEGT